MSAPRLTHTSFLSLRRVNKQPGVVLEYFLHVLLTGTGHLASFVFEKIF